MEECAICISTIEHDRLELSCHHSFHSFCMYDWIVYNNTCPMCRACIKSELIQEDIIFKLLNSHTTDEREKILQLIPNIKVYIDKRLIRDIVEQTTFRPTVDEQRFRQMKKVDLIRFCKNNDIRLKNYNTKRKHEIIDIIMNHYR